MQEISKINKDQKEENLIKRRKLKLWAIVDAEGDLLANFTHGRLVSQNKEELQTYLAEKQKQDGRSARYEIIELHEK